MSSEEKSFTKVGINWYPGHMAKTKRLIKERINEIDIVYELVDARIPYSSKIKDLDEVIKNKKRILIMTKKDLCDMSITLKWQEEYKKDGYEVIIVDLTNEVDYQKIISKTHELTSDIQLKRKNKGLKEKEIRALVIGILANSVRNH